MMSIRTRPESADSHIDGHKFNDDLLVSAEDQALAKRLYGRVAYALINKPLMQQFIAIDNRANRMKRTSRRAGLSAISLILVALLTATVEPVIATLSGGESDLPITLAASSAALGILGAVTAYRGVLRGASKTQWLYDRLLTERLRQLHFQGIVARIPLVVEGAASDVARERFQELQSKDLERFLADYSKKQGAFLSSTLSFDAIENHQLEGEPHYTATQIDAVKDSKAFAELRQAYERLRIEHQRNYANYKLREKGSALRPSPVQLNSVLGGVASTCVFLILLAHVIAVGTLLLGSSAHSDPNASHGNLSLQLLIPVATVSLAIIALAARAFHDGTAAKEETVHFKEYKHDVNAMLGRYRAAIRRPRDLQKTMTDMELLSQEEMAKFLRYSNRASYLM